MKTRFTFSMNRMKTPLITAGLFLVSSFSYLVNAQPATVYDVISGSASHTTLKAAIDAAGLDATLKGAGPFTVFAPTDDAFAALPAGTVETLLADPGGALTDILLYHVVGAKALSTDLSDGQMIITAEGKQVKVTIRNDSVLINNALVTVADISADNGVVHVINAVLIPPVVTVYDVISGSASHTTLKAAIDAAGLDSVLMSEGPFTVFAPTDAAFAALPAGTVETLLADPSGALTDILLYHVVGAKALSTDLSDGQVITTAGGKTLTVTIRNDSVLINEALVTVADLNADNGVVHVIDAVLIPAAQPTGVKNVKALSVDVYPNPAKDFVVLRLENMKSASVKILSMEGRLIRSYDALGNGSTLDLSGIQNGKYILVAKDASKQVVGKLVISR